MKRLLSVIALLAWSAASPAVAQTVAISGVRLIDGRGGVPLDDATIIVTDGRIAAVGHDAAIPDGARRLDYRGRVVMPGMTTDHSHVGLVAGTGVAGKNYTRANITAELAQFRRYGITTVTSNTQRIVEVWTLGLNRCLACVVD